MLSEVAVDGRLESSERMEAPAPEAFPGQGREEGLDGVQPRAGCGREMERPPWMAREPRLYLGVLVGGAVVDHGVDQLARGHLALDRVEEADELLVAVALHAPADHGAVEHVERREQRGRAVPVNGGSTGSVLVLDHDRDGKRSGSPQYGLRCVGG